MWQKTAGRCRPAGVWRWLERGGCRGRLRHSARRYFVYHPSTRRAAAGSRPVEVPRRDEDPSGRVESAAIKAEAVQRLVASRIQFVHCARTTVIARSGGGATIFGSSVEIARRVGDYT